MILASPVFSRAFVLTRRTWSEIVTLVKLTQKRKGSSCKGSQCAHTWVLEAGLRYTGTGRRWKKEPGAAGPVEHL